jgi:hypothetical protein
VKRFLLLASVLFVVAFCALTSPAYAQASRTWVSGVGDDANPCSRTAPCKTWAGAISKTASGGEIDALDPGGFGAVTITKAITIDGGGGQVASVLVAGTNGFVVTAGASDVITIRNMRLQGLVRGTGGIAAAGINGVNFTQGGELNVENCNISEFGGAGINFIPNSASFLNVINTSFEDDFGGAINIAPAGGSARATINGVNALSDHSGQGGAGIGIAVGANATVGISNSTISQNAIGLLANGTNASVLVFQSQLVGNNTGISATNNGVVSVASTAIFGSTGLGISTASGGAVNSFGNNYLFGNGGGNGTFTPPALHPLILRRTPPR